MIKKLYLTVLLGILTGCANMEYVKDMRPEDMLYEAEYKGGSAFGGISSIEKEELALTIGADKSGFISPDRSVARINFEKDYPIQNPEPNALQVITELDHGLRAGQANAFGVDIDDRTSGYLKDAKGNPMSVTGKISVRASDIAAESALMGGTSGIGAGLATVNQAAQSGTQLSSASQGAAMVSGFATGLAGGLIAGLITSGQAESAINGFIQSNNFGGENGVCDAHGL